MILRFGAFELDPAGGDLRRSGVRIRVQDQPLKILLALVERPGEVITREELRSRIWGDTFVDFDQALNTAVRKLRQALNDNAEAPRFVETLARRGYRFVAPVEKIEPAVAATAAVPTPISEPAERRRAPLHWALAALVLVTFAAFLYVRRSPAADINSIAVLPFVNLTGDARNEYIADGMTESLISDLAHIGSLQVISRTSAMQYKNAKKPLPQIASELKVSGIVEGSVLRFGDRARVEVKLIDAQRDALLWSAEYERLASELDVLQREVAGAIASQLRTRVAPSPSRAPDPEAHLLYLRARDRLGEGARPGENYAHELFRRAIARDPQYAAAYAGLAEAEMFVPPPEVSPYDSFTRAKAAAEKAVQFDPNLGDAHAALGLVRMFLDRDFDAAEAEFRRAIALSPGAVAGHHRIALLLAVRGRFDDAIAAAKRASELDPYSTIVLVDYGRVLYFARRYPEAEAVLRRAITVNPTDTLAPWFLMMTLERERKYDEAARIIRIHLRRNDDTDSKLGNFDEILADGGYRAVMKQWVRRDAERTKAAPFVRSCGLAGRAIEAGDYDVAFEWFERAYQSHTRDLVFLGIEPQYDVVRGDPRFVALMRKVGVASVAP